MAADCPATSCSRCEILCITRVCTFSTKASSICSLSRSDSACSRDFPPLPYEPPRFLSSQPCSSPRNRRLVWLSASALSCSAHICARTAEVADDDSESDPTRALCPVPCSVPSPARFCRRFSSSASRSDSLRLWGCDPGSHVAIASPRRMLRPEDQSTPYRRCENFYQLSQEKSTQVVICGLYFYLIISEIVTLRVLLSTRTGVILCITKTQF